MKAATDIYEAVFGDAEIDLRLGDAVDIMDRKLKFWDEHETPKRYPAHRVQLATEIAFEAGIATALGRLTQRYELEVQANRLNERWLRAQRRWHESATFTEEDWDDE